MVKPVKEKVYNEEIVRYTVVLHPVLCFLNSKFNKVECSWFFDQHSPFKGGRLTNKVENLL